MPVISKAEELKTVRGKNIIWKKDGARMVFINYKGTIAEPVYNEFGNIINEGEVVGITDIVAKSVGSSNPYNVLRACISGLKSQLTPKNISSIRAANSAPGRAALYASF